MSGRSHGILGPGDTAVGASEDPAIGVKAWVSCGNAVYWTKTNFKNKESFDNYLFYDKMILHQGRNWINKLKNIHMEFIALINVKTPRFLIIPGWL